jgi:hypothetical protein
MRPPVSGLCEVHEKKAGKTICGVVERLREKYAV